MATINGRLVSDATRRPLAGLRVEAWSGDRRRKRPLATAEADDQGNFSLDVDPSRAGVALRVLQDERLVLDTAANELWDPGRGDRPVVVPVPHPDRDGDRTELYSAEGVVATEHGVAGAGLRVELWDHNVDGATLVSAATTDDSGHYSVLYEPASLGGKERADLEIRVVDRRRQSPLG